MIRYWHLEWPQMYLHDFLTLLLYHILFVDAMVLYFYPEYFFWGTTTTYIMILYDIMILYFKYNYQGSKIKMKNERYSHFYGLFPIVSIVSFHSKVWGSYDF